MISNKIKEVEKLISKGTKVYIACKEVGIKPKDYYNFRANKNRRLSVKDIKKATKILYMSLTHEKT